MAVVKTQSIDFTRVFDILSYQQQRYPNTLAVNKFSKGNWQPSSITTLREKADQISLWLLKSGFKNGDTILVIPESGLPEWIAIDMACQQIGIIQVIVNAATKTTELLEIIAETKCRLCISYDEINYQKLSTIENLDCSVYHLQNESIGYFAALHENRYSEIELNIILQESALVKDSDTVFIIYTSGSSGSSKGVELSHANIVFNIKSILTILPLQNTYKALSFLPFSHIFERVSCYAYIAFGISIFFNDEKARFTKDLRTVRPDIFGTVPRVFEKMYEFIETRLESSSAFIRKFTHWAVKAAQSYDRPRASVQQRIQLYVIKLLVLNKWKNALGGRIKIIVVGAASLRPDIGKLVAASGIKVLEGYGMTEMAPLISLNRAEPGMQKWGTVGKVIRGIDIHIEKTGDTDEGEIWVKGPNLMKGYFNKPKLTDAAITDDGWFMTGDIGKLSEGFLQITDRKKDLFKTSSGIYIAPMPLQNHFTRSHFIDKCLIVGFQKPFVTALIVPNFEMVENYCFQQNIHYTDPMYMVHNIKVKEKMQQEINVLNEELASHERVRDFVLCPKDWSVEDGSLTLTFKPVRKRIEDLYQKEIDAMYE